jgi:DNA-binding transcriptional MerR regulator
MSNLAVQNSSFSNEKSFSEKATPVAPQDSSKPAKKAQGAFRTISEVAEELDVPQHVLRFWETKFSQVKPLKRGGGRRYYRPEDVSLLKHIHYLLYTEGYTIKGVQKLLKGQGKNQIAAKADALEDAAHPAPAQPQQPKAQLEGQITLTPSANAPAKVYNLSDRQRTALEDMLSELKALRALFPEEAA